MKVALSVVSLDDEMVVPMVAMRVYHKGVLTDEMMGVTSVAQLVDERVD